MILGRRNPVGFGERVRTMLWPRSSFARSARYFGKRALRLQASPHAVGAGVACGVFISFLPIPGFHVVLAALLAWLISANAVAAVLGTAVGNPLSFPLLWGVDYEVGRLILDGGASDGAMPLDIGAALSGLDVATLWGPVLKPIVIGSVPLGLVCALVAYGLTRRAVSVVRDRRSLRRAEAGAVRP